MTAPYIGRFAPSPTGPLHAGSLVAALASYLDARAAHGQWLVRIEDIDPPREIPGISPVILTQLETHGLHWDGDICYQSQCQEHYLAALENLATQNLLFACTCNRERIRANGGQYDGACRAHVLQAHAINTVLANNNTHQPGAAIRIRTDTASLIQFDDLIQGSQRTDLLTNGGDFIVRRRDQLIAYQLAVAVDDIRQGISHVIRGDDLLDSTPRQIFLMNALHANTSPSTSLSIPQYAHVPVVVDATGKKLSKQNKTQALDPNTPTANLYKALQWLNQNPPPTLLGATPAELISWAIAHWNRQSIAANATEKLK